MQKAIKVFTLLKKIPKCKVTTYKDIAVKIKSSPRAIGSILRSNRNPDKYPCYKVVMSSGKIGGYCGSNKKIKLKIEKLKKDGIKINNDKVDLKKYLHRFT